LGRAIAGLRNAFAALMRTPFFWFTSKRDTPSLSPRLKSSTFGIPDSAAASANASRMSHRSLGVSTRHSPPCPCFSSAPRHESSDLMNTGSTLRHAQPPSPVTCAHSS
jgi:hypothetical protein